MLLVLCALLGYTIKRRKIRRFTMTILLSMFCKYTVWVYYYLFVDTLQSHKLVSAFLITLASISGPISHWAYASQYMKTCMLIPGLTSRARLLMEKHKNTIENEFEQSLAACEFVRIHKEIDEDIKTEKQRAQKLSLQFVKVDCLVITTLLVCEFAV